MRPANELDEPGAEDPHEAREHDEIRLVRSEQRGQRGVVVGALLAAHGAEVQRFDAGGARALEAASGAAVADDGHDLGAELLGPRGVDQRLQIAAFAGDQHGDARGGACHRSGSRRGVSRLAAIIRDVSRHGHTAWGFRHRCCAARSSSRSPLRPLGRRRAARRRSPTCTRSRSRRIPPPRINAKRPSKPRWRGC